MAVELHIRSRILAFHWYRNWWPWMTLNGIMAVIFLFFAEFGTFAKIGVRPILSATKRVSIVITYTLCTCTPSISVSFSCIICSASLIGVATILSAVHFLLKKVDDFLFLVVALSKDGENALNLLINPPNLPRPAKNDIKIDSCSASGGGYTWCPGVHLQIFPVNYA